MSAVEQAEANLAAFCDKWDAIHSKVTTKGDHGPGIVPNDEATFQQICLAMINTSYKWTMPVRDRKATRISSSACLNIGSEPGFHS